MKAITIRQPWASLIAAGIKQVENRSWRPAVTPLTLAVHAGAKRMTHPDADRYGSATYSAILAVVTVTGAHHPGDDCGTCCTMYGRADAVWHWTLDDVMALPSPITATGRLGLWTLDDDVATLVEDVLTAPAGAAQRLGQQLVAVPDLHRRPVV